MRRKEARKEPNKEISNLNDDDMSYKWIVAITTTYRLCVYVCLGGATTYRIIVLDVLLRLQSCQLVNRIIYWHDLSSKVLIGVGGYAWFTFSYQQSTAIFCNPQPRCMKVRNYRKPVMLVPWLNIECGLCSRPHTWVFITDLWVCLSRYMRNITTTVHRANVSRAYTLERES